MGNTSGAGEELLLFQPAFFLPAVNAAFSIMRVICHC
jgi:hypothetical protein